MHTPQALLSRDPNQLREDLGPHVPLHAVLDLRASVADAVVRRTHGKESRNLRARVKPWIDRIVPFVPPQQRKRKRPFVEGSVTALELCAHDFVATTTTTFSSRFPTALSTGSAALDELMSSSSSSSCSFSVVVTDGPPNPEPRDDRRGVAFGSVTELVGPSASGKTQTTLAVVVDALRRNVRVLWIAAGGGNSSLVPLAERLRDLSSSRRHPVDRRSLENVEFVRASDGHRVLTALASLRRNDDDDDDMERHLEDRRLVVLDSASGCLSPHLCGNGDGGTGSALVAGIGSALRRTARVRDDAVLVTNGVVRAGRGGRERRRGNDDRDWRPAMSNVWKFADVRIGLKSLRHDERNNTRIVRATLDGHKTEPLRRPNESVEFAISKDGVSDAPS